MAYKLIAPTGTSALSNPKFVRFRASDGAVWSTAGTPAFEAYNASNIANYGIAGAEIGSTGIYQVTDPAEGTFGDWLFVAAAGSSLAVSDLVSNIYYTGESDSKDVTATGSGASAEEVWSYSSRKLTSGPAIVNDNIEYEAWTIVKGNSYSETNQPKEFTLAATGPDDLSHYTWTFAADRDENNEDESGDATFTGTVVVVDASGDDRRVRVDLATTVTDSLSLGAYTGVLRGTNGSDKTSPKFVAITVVDDPNQA